MYTRQKDRKVVDSWVLTEFIQKQTCKIVSSVNELNNINN